MSFIALARKWRPRTFSQLVGQEHINKALINSLNQQRLHHAYLFTGTRGVGKTSIARLLAKALNCETGIGASPCLQCETCLAIEQGRFFDLIEIDGASKTRVEDTREVLENVQYAPTCGRFKIYIIDEVHMLSQHSFNALLKTLEEPPQHVKFLLATTDPQKLPITVLSRCLQFHLKPLLPEVISQHLQHILDSEYLVFEKSGLDLLAKAARGSMRDALSLLDQAIACGETGLQTSSIKSMLGHTLQDYALLLLQALAEFSVDKMITLSRKINDVGGSFLYVLEGILEHLHQILLYQSLPNTSPFLIPHDDVIHLSKQFTPEDTQLFYQIALKGIDEIQLAPTLAIGFEMILLRMHTFRPVTEPRIPELAFQNKSDEVCTQATPIQPTLPTTHTDWNVILPALKLTGLALSAAENAGFVRKDDLCVVLSVAKGHESLFTPAIISRIEAALGLYYKEAIRLTLDNHEPTTATPAQKKQTNRENQQQHAELALQNDVFFQQLQNEFEAEIIKNSITSTEDAL